MDQSVLVISFSDLSRDPRVNRQIRALAERYRVTAAGFGDPGIAGVEFVRIEQARRSIPARAWAAAQLRTGRFEAFYWSLAHVRSGLTRLAGVRADAVIANDIDALPLAFRLAAGASIILDAHEYAPRQFEDRLGFRLFFQRYKTELCRRYIPRVDAMMTVGEAIAGQYAADTGVRPVVVTNAPDYEPIEPAPVQRGGPIRIVHHGAALPSRRIENMIELMDGLGDGFTLDLILVEGPPGYMRKLRRLVEGRPRTRLRDPVPMRELPRFLNGYDIGLYILEPANFNSRYALPNKIFEFVQARLAVAVGPSPEMARLVREHGCGIVARDFSARAMADAIHGLDAEAIERFKRRSHEAARTLSAESNRDRLRALIADALARRPRVSTPMHGHDT